MRVRLYAEIDLDDGRLLAQFGEQLPSLTAAHEIEAGLARVTETLLSQVPGVASVKAIFIPKLLDR